jgi:hypothetical protein
MRRYCINGVEGEYNEDEEHIEDLLAKSPKYNLVEYKNINFGYNIGQDIDFSVKSQISRSSPVDNSHQKKPITNCMRKK